LATSCVADAETNVDLRKGAAEVDQSTVRALKIPPRDYRKRFATSKGAIQTALRPPSTASFAP
jgi:hypothetical protein